MRYPSNTPAEVKFWAKVSKASDDECWLWTGRKITDGYGQMETPEKRGMLAHRFSWLIHRGPIPQGMKVLHNCPGGDNPACVNPAHLWIGTQGENVRDAISKGRAINLRGEEHGRAKLTDAMVREIRRLCASGHTKKEVGRLLNISDVHIGRIVLRRNWKHLP